MSSILIIGVGNQYRQDDGLGLEVLKHLNHLKDIDLVKHGGEASTLMECWSKHQQVIIIDALQTGDKPGSILRFDALSTPLPANLSNASTHAFGVAEAIEMSRVFSQLPQRLILFGIEGKDFNYGVGLSEEITLALRQLIPLLEQEVQELRRTKYA